VVECKEKLHARCCHWYYRCFAFTSSSCVAMAQSKRKCVFVAKFHTSSLSQYNDVFMLAVKHDWKVFASVKSRIVNFKTTFWYQGENMKNMKLMNISLKILKIFVENIQWRKFCFTRFGTSRVVCDAHLPLLCAVGHVATFAVNVARVAGQWNAWTLKWLKDCRIKTFCQFF